MSIKRLKRQYINPNQLNLGVLEVIVSAPMYKCHQCKAPVDSCKLWIDDKVGKLFCADCAAADENVDIGDMDPCGRISRPDRQDLRTDRIGENKRPAVACKHGLGGYPVTPEIEPEYHFWITLPNRYVKKENTPRKMSFQTQEGGQNVQSSQVI